MVGRGHRQRRVGLELHKWLDGWRLKLIRLLPEGYEVTYHMHNYGRSYSFAVWPKGTHTKQSWEYLVAHKPPPRAYQFGWIGYEDGYEGPEVDEKAIKEIAREEWERAG